MSLLNLIKKGGLANGATVTPATIATHAANEPVTVAPVATVTVAMGTELASALSPDEEENILLWLAYIEEADQAIITEVMDKCHDDLDARRYFLKRSDEVSELVPINRSATCGYCIHFERIDHPNLGHCAKGEPEAIAGLWDTDQRYCELYSAQQDNPTEVQTSANEAKT